jgi:ABC-type nitrate/sulfonate/bicarbonate transport system substrate-binding protein
MRSIFSMTRVVFLLSLIGLLGPGTGVSAEKVKFSLDWIPIGKHAPFYASLTGMPSTENHFLVQIPYEVTVY